MGNNRKASYRVIFYKTLEDPMIQRACFGHELIEGRPVEIANYKPVQYSHGYVDIERSEGDTTPGILYELTKRDFMAAVQWEAERYVPIGVELTDGSSAVAFQFRSDHRREVARLRSTATVGGVK